MNDKNIRHVTQGVIKALGVCFLIWLFGLLILIPLARPENIPQSIIAFIVLIPVAALLFTAVPALNDFSHETGQAMQQRRKTWIDTPKPFIHAWYAVWLIVGGILLIPLLYLISPLFGGLAFFAVLAGLGYLLIVDFPYITEFLVRYLKPVEESQQKQQQKPQGQ